VRADLVIEGLRPPVLAVVTSVGTVVCCLVKRSALPAVIGAVGLLLAASSTLAAKLLVGRPDPHGYLAAHGGSFPSGHVITIMVSVGLAALMIHPLGYGWIALVPAAVAGAVMGACLLIQSAHWASDVIGGIVLACWVLATLRACLEFFRLRRRQDSRSLRSPPWLPLVPETSASSDRQR